MGKLHALLIGIDATPGMPLRGCVNDIDAVQRILLDPRLGGPVHITRLVAPLPGHTTAVADAPPTLAAIRAALAHLASDAVTADDRVFIYYSGHGGRAGVPRHAPVDYREALVPVDYTADKPAGAYRALYDDELNRALAAIARRTPAVGVVLDCCFAAGATRGGADGVRFVDLGEDDVTRGAAADPRPLARGVDDCHVVAACLDHECAREGLDRHGVRHGVFTCALVAALERAADLAALTWAEIWQAVRAELAAHDAGQHPWMAGHLARRVFGGPPVHGDAGIPITLNAGAYAIDAGTLAGVTRGAELAVYGRQPAYFAALGSHDDEAARLGVVRVVTAEPGTALAIARGAPFVVPPGARGRVIAAGERARLQVAVVPPVADVVAAIAASPLLAITGDPAAADVRLVAHAGAWRVLDDVHPLADDAPVLCALADAERGRARAVLEHYVAYARPVRLAAALAGDRLGLRVLACPAHVRRGDALAVRAHLPEAPSPGAGRYDLHAGDEVCFELRNHARAPLLVTLINAAASGRVQILAAHVLAPGARDVVWCRNDSLTPFAAAPPAGRDAGRDRLIAIGRPPADTTLDFLRVDATFAHALAGAPPAPDDDPLTRGAAETWTATQVVITTRR